MISRSDFSCFYCKQIIKNPIDLPCQLHTICAEHLKEPNKKVIHCKVCKIDFNLNKKSSFKSNQKMQTLLNEEVYLSDEEKKFKNSLLTSIQLFSDLLNEFKQNKKASMKENTSHFQEIQFKLGQQRELFKNQIDKIYYEMIDQTKKMEVFYHSHFEAIVYNGTFKSFEDESKKLKEKFRDQNISLDSMNKIKWEQDEAILNIKSKLNELIRIKTYSTKLNDFEPKSLILGQLDFREFPFDKSLILNQKQSYDLIQLCEFTFKEKWTLIYRGSSDGFGARDFHAKCDDKSSTLTILKSSEFIFGAYTNMAWESSNCCKTDPKAFIFSLTNKDNIPCKIKIAHGSNAIMCLPNFGPIFGNGADIFIVNNANANKENSSNLGFSFRHDRYKYLSREARSFLAGCPFFLLSEIEVYQKE